MGLKERLRSSLGPVTMHVEPGKITLASGAVITKEKYGQPLTHEVAWALRYASEGEVIGCRGHLAGAAIGGGDPNHADVGFWPNGQPIKDVAIVSDDPAQRASIGDLSIGDSLGGIDNLTVCDVQLRNKSWSRSAILVTMDAETGRLRVWSCDFQPEDLNAWAGWGCMWNVRAHGKVDGVDVIDCDLWPGQEHGGYFDNVGWRTGRRSRFKHNRTKGTRGFGRTGAQFCNRANEGASSKGLIEISDNDLRVEAGGGGYAITVAGHLGPVLLKRNVIRGNGNHGGVVFWSDGGKGLHKTDDGYTCPFVRIDDLTVEGDQLSYPLVALSGIREAQIGHFDLKGHTTCVDLWNSYGGPVDNGTVGFDLPAPVSAYAGFRGGAKVKRRNLTLSDAQIDSMLLEATPRGT